MAPEKDSKTGHSADATHDVSVQWVIDDFEQQHPSKSIEATDGARRKAASLMIKKTASRPALSVASAASSVAIVDVSQSVEVEAMPEVNSKPHKNRRKQTLKHRIDIPSCVKEEEVAPVVSKRTAKKMKLIDKEVSRLEQLVFGDPTPMMHNLDMSEVGHCEEVVTSLEREWCREGNSAAAALELDNKQLPAWVDDEEDTLTVQEVINKGGPGKRRKTALPVSATTDRYDQLLQRQFEGLVGTPKWARLDETTSQDDDDSTMRHCGDLLADSSRTLAPHTLQFRRLTDLTEKGVSKRTIITAVDFHPSTQAAVVANRPGLATFYQVDGEENTRIQSVMFENFPISSAKFLVDGSELLIGSEYRAYMQSYDMHTGKALHIPCPISGPELASMSNFSLSPDGKLVALAGRDGTIVLMTAHTREWVGSCKMSGKCHALTFTSDSSNILSYGKEGQVYIWDVGQRRCVHRFHDDGCLQGLSMAVSAGDRYVACGSGSGVVNIYHGATVLPSSTGKLTESPTPAKAIMNLTTAAHQVVFNSSAQLLATVSRCKDSAVKLVHLPSLTVYANFPTKSLELARPEVVAFSPNGGYMAVGNNIGSVRLFRLHHFKNY